jgi:CHASE1-domain containing sensor protein
MQRFQSQSFRRSYFVLIVALTLKACAAFYVVKAAHEEDRLRFERMSDRTRDAMTARLRTYVATLRGAGLIHVINLQRRENGAEQAPVSRHLVGRVALHNYVRQLRLQIDFPGIQGIDFSARASTTKG